MFNKFRLDGEDYKRYITVEFENDDYLYKTNSTSETAHGEPIGDFTLLQRWIEGNITNGKYEIHLPRTMRFTPYYGNDTTYTLDTKCMNLTNIKKYNPRNVNL